MGYIGPAVEMEWHEELASQTLTPDGILTSFTMDRSVATDAGVAVFYENLRQQPGSAYTVSGTTINFTFTPQTGKSLYLVFFASQTAQTTPAAGTVVEASLDSTVASPVLLSTATASASATIDFDSGVDWTAYSVYMFELIGVRPTTDDVELWVRVSTDGGSTYKSGATDYRWSMSGTRTASTVTGGSSGATSAVIGGESGATQALSNASTDSWCGRLWLYEMNVAATTTRWCGVSTSKSAVGSFQEFQFGGQYETGGVTDGFQFILESGTIASGTFKLYGLR